METTIICNDDDDDDDDDDDGLRRHHHHHYTRHLSRANPTAAESINTMATATATAPTATATASIAAAAATPTPILLLAPNSEIRQQLGRVTVCGKAERLTSEIQVSFFFAAGSHRLPGCPHALITGIISRFPRSLENLCTCDLLAIQHPLMIPCTLNP